MGRRKSEAKPRRRRGYTIYVVPHSHIDVEWTWDYPETIRKVNAIFGSVLNLLKTDPNYNFSQDQVPCIEPFLDRLSDEDREIFLKYCREGRFEIVGGMYVQPEVAEPHGEALVRQIVYGRKWFAEKLGVTDIPAVWNADTFGQVSQLPQICAKAGFKYFCYSRGVDLLAGEQLSTDFRLDGAPEAKWRPSMPSDFWWKSPDGTRIQTHWMATGYPARVGGTKTEEVAEQVKEIAAHATTKSLLFPWGQDCYDPGDEGSSFILSCFDPKLFGIPTAEIKISSAREYLDSVAAQSDGLPELTHDMAECDLRGTYDNRHRQKQANRRAEQMMLAAEKLSTLCACLGFGYPADQLPDLWRKVLYNHFHDIIGGSHIDATYVKAMARYDDVINEADSIIQEGLQALGSRIDIEGGHSVVVFNPSSYPATGLCTAEVRFSPHDDVRSIVMKDSSGEIVPPVSVERILGRGGHLRLARISFIARDVPAIGYTSYRVLVNAEEQAAPKTSLRTGENWIESPAFKVTADPVTGSVSVFDRRRNQVVSHEANELVADEEIEPNLEGHSIRFSGVSHQSRDWKPDEIKAEVSGRTALLRISGPYKDCSRLVREIRLYEDIPLVDFKTRIEDFHGGDVMIKARFPLAPGEIFYETPFAVTKRPEGHYCAQTWAGIQDAAGGVAVINKGTAGYYSQDGVLDLVLMRSAADYRGYEAHLANEHGTHEIEYALYSYPGRWEDSELIELAHAYNASLYAREVRAENGILPAKGSLLETSGDGVEWVAVKKAESHKGIVLRGYETRGRSATARVKLPIPCSEVWLADLLERPIKKLAIKNGEVSYECGKWEIFTLLLVP